MAEDSQNQTENFLKMPQEENNLLEVGDLVYWNSALSREEYYEIMSINIDNNVANIEGETINTHVSLSELSIHTKAQDIVYSLTPKGLLYFLIQKELNISMDSKKVSNIYEQFVEYMYKNNQAIILDGADLTFINFEYLQKKENE